MLAGYLSSREERTDALGTALKWGAAAVQHEGTLFSPNVFEGAASITDDIDPSMRLRDSDSANGKAGVQ
jgi:1-phosphofructokinase